MNINYNMCSLTSTTEITNLCRYYPICSEVNFSTEWKQVACVRSRVTSKNLHSTQVSILNGGDDNLVPSHPEKHVDEKMLVRRTKLRTR